MGKPIRRSGAECRCVNVIERVLDGVIRCRGLRQNHNRHVERHRVVIWAENPGSAGARDRRGGYASHNLILNVRFLRVDGRTFPNL